GNAFGTQRQRRQQAAAVGKTTGSDDRNGHFAGNRRHQHQRGNIAAVGGGFMAGNQQGIGANGLGRQRVFFRDHGGNHFAAVGVGALHNPVAFAEGKVNHRHLFVQRYVGVFFGTRHQQRNADTKGLAG